MRTQIKKIAQVQMGYSFRSRLESSEDGDLSVIQMKDLRADNTVDCSALAKIDMEDVKVHHLVRKDDLIFRSRGLVSTAAILHEDLSKAVVAAPLLRLRVIEQDRVLSEYLNWYIAQRNAQEFLSRRADGTFQKMINKQGIENLEVLIPSVETQRRIVDLARLFAKEKTLLHTLTEKREQYISAVLMQCAQGE